MDNLLDSTVTRAGGHSEQVTGSPSGRILVSCAVLAIVMGLCLGLLVTAWAVVLLLPIQ